jgi:hypothetical protein
MERSQGFSFLLLASLIAAAPVWAENDPVCDDLRGQLANVTETVETRHDSRQQSDAISIQNTEIERLTRDFDDFGCAFQSGSIVSAEDAAACDQMEYRLERMQENQRYLMAREDDVGRQRGPEGALRAQLQAALRENGCDEPPSSGTQTIDGYSGAPATPEQQAMRTDTFYPPMDNGDIGRPAYDGALDGNLQTVCVRTCDGGFFPITANATPFNFQHDEETCARMCPGVPTELFFRYLPNQESSEMVSASTGAPYSEMPYAFAYRKRAPGEKTSCTCNLSAFYEQMRREKGLGTPADRQQQGSITSIETLKTATPNAADSEPAKPPEDRAYDPATSKVRQVGPQFLATDQGKIDLRHPATRGPQPQQ